MIQGAIFDMDGLMVDSERVWCAQWPQVCEEAGVPYRPEVADRTRGTTDERGAEILEEIYSGIKDVDGAQMIRRLHELAGAVFRTQGVPAKPGLFELMNYLGGWHIPCAVASSSSLELIHLHLGHLGLEGAYQDIVSGRDSGIAHSKPAPDIFLEAARQLGVEPERTLVLEDSYSGVKAGAAGHFITIMVPDLSPVTDEMRGTASYICQDLAEVADLLDQGFIDA